MTCCKCNKSGSCKGCTCAKVNTPCVSCLPGKLGKCVNLTLIPKSQTQSQLPTKPDSSQSSNHIAQTSTYQSSAGESVIFQGNTAILNTEKNDFLPDSSLLRSVPVPTSPQNSECFVPTNHVDPLLCRWLPPAAPPVSDPSFTWGSLDALSFIDLLEKAYDQVVHWKLNLFPYLLVRLENSLCLSCLSFIGHSRMVLLLNAYL